MTIDDLKRMTCDFITPGMAADVIHMSHDRMQQYAKNTVDPEAQEDDRKYKLPPPVVVVKCSDSGRVKIVRQSFIDYLEGRKPTAQRASADSLAEIAKEMKLLTAIWMAMLTVTAPEIAERLMDKEEGLQ